MHLPGNIPPLRKQLSSSHFRHILR